MSSPGPSLGQSQSNIDLWGGERKTVFCRIPLIVNSEELSDVKFIFNTEEGEKIILGHKLILALASPVFHKLFYSKSPGFATDVNENQIKMEGQLLALGPQAFEHFMKFVYMGKIDPKEFNELSVEIIIGILSYADYYDVPYLKEQCGVQLFKNLTKENVIPILETALLFKEEQLANQALKVIDNNAEFVFASEEILRVTAGTLCEIFKRDSLGIDECFIFELAMDWAENKCNIENLDPSSMGNKRKVLGPALLEIRFALLPSERISDIVRSGLLTSDETVEMFLQHRESGMALTHDKRVARDVLFKSNVRFQGLKTATNKKEVEVAKVKLFWSVSTLDGEVIYCSGKKFTVPVSDLLSLAEKTEPLCQKLVQKLQNILTD